MTEERCTMCGAVLNSRSHSGWCLKCERVVHKDCDMEISGLRVRIKELRAENERLAARVLELELESGIKARCKSCGKVIDVDAEEFERGFDLTDFRYMCEACQAMRGSTE